ncbi:DUF1553 domain-containing protein [Pirellulales bacterium]|nr:DUF1553 domain-containing protein [Pirellulales bacterium]
MTAPIRFHSGKLKAALAIAAGLCAITCRASEQVAAAADDPVDPILEQLVAARDKDQVQKLFTERRSERLKTVAAPPTPPAVTGQVAGAIDRFIIDRFLVDGGGEAEHVESIHPPALSSDAAFLRRVYLDVIGVIPTVEQAKLFSADRSPDKRERLVDELLDRHDDYADHWTAFWQEAIGSANSEVIGGIPTRGSYREFLRTSFQTNKPFDLMVAELVTPRLPGHQPVKIMDILDGKQTLQIGFVQNDTHQHTSQTAAVIGQVFLGTSMKCASCHSHFLNEEWSHERFLAFAGLFVEQDLEQIRCEQHTGKTIPARFAFDLPGAPRTIPADVDGRLHLAAMLLTDPHNPRFAKAAVNRLWKRYLGLGLFEPVDDFRLDTPASHPELLEWLAYDFMAHGFDWKHTIKLILTSRTYQSKFDPQLVDHFDTEEPGQPRYYRSPTLRKMTAEQLIDSIRLLTTQKFDASEREYLDSQSTPLLRSLGKPSERTEISTARSEDVAVVQSLELLNGSEYHELVCRSPIVNVLAGMSDHRPVVEQLFWATLSRPPTPRERALAVDFLGESIQPGETGSERQAIGDLLWTLVTGPEFQFIH